MPSAKATRQWNARQRRRSRRAGTSVMKVGGGSNDMVASGPASQLPAQGAKKGVAGGRSRRFALWHYRDKLLSFFPLAGSWTLAAPRLLFRSFSFRTLQRLALQ